MSSYVKYGSDVATILCTRLLSADEVNKKVPAIMIYARRTKRKKKKKTKLRKNSIRKGKRNTEDIKNHHIF